MTIKLIKKPKSINLKVINDLLLQLDPNCKTHEIDSIKKILQQKNTFLLGAYKNNQGHSLIGIVILVFYRTLSGFCCRIEDFVVDEKERGKGIGTKMLKKAILIAKNRKVEFIELTSRPERKIANLLYKKMGFQIKKTNVYRYYFS